MIAADDDRPGARRNYRGNARLNYFVAALDADRRRVDVTNVCDIQHIERRDLLKIAVWPDQRRLRADLSWPETRARTIRRSAVERHSHDRHVETPRILDVRQTHERRRMREARRRERRSRLVSHAPNSTGISYSAAS